MTFFFIVPEYSTGNSFHTDGISFWEETEIGRDSKEDELDSSIYRDDVQHLVNDGTMEVTGEIVSEKPIQNSVPNIPSTLNIEIPLTISGSSAPMVKQDVLPVSGNNCPMQENLLSCSIYLCRVLRNMLALPFPDCYAN